MKTTLIVEIESDEPVDELCDKIGGRIWTMFSGKRDVQVRIATDEEIEAINECRMPG